MKSPSMRQMAQFVLVVVCAAAFAACNTTIQPQFYHKPAVVPVESRVPWFNPTTSTPVSPADLVPIYSSNVPPVLMAEDEEPCDECEGGVCGIPPNPLPPPRHQYGFPSKGKEVWMGGKRYYVDLNPAKPPPAESALEKRIRRFETAMRFLDARGYEGVPPWIDLLIDPEVDLYGFDR